MILKKISRILFVGCFLLVGCNKNGDENYMNQDTGVKNSRTSIEQTVSNSFASNEIVGTDEYGRGARSDGRDTNSQVKPVKILTKDADSLIIYFSRSGNTENLAKMIYLETQADVLELTLLEPYPSNYEQTVNRANQERESDNFPKISTEIPNLVQYQQIYLGYQTWAMTLSNPIISFFKDNSEKIDGKIIYPFSTNAGYGEGDSLEQISKFLPNSTIASGFAVEDRDVISSQKKLKNWLKINQQTNQKIE